MLREESITSVYMSIWFFGSKYLHIEGVNERVFYLLFH